jgi:protein TonB
VLVAAACVTAGHASLTEPLVAQTATIRVAPDEPGPLEARAKPVTAKNPVPKRLRSELPPYPQDSPSRDLHATIALRLVLDESGRVYELRFLRPASTSFRSTPGRGVNLGSLGPAARAPHVLEPFVNAATAAVREWQYERPAVAPLAFDIAFEFHPGAATELVVHGLTTRGTFSAGSTGTYTIGRASAEPPPGWPAAARLGPNDLPPRAVTRVRPVYPIAAAFEGVQGYVVLEARIGEDGRVTHARVVESIPLLDAAALEAMMQWVFMPPRVDRAPSAVLLTVSMQFILN